MIPVSSRLFIDAPVDTPVWQVALEICGPKSNQIKIPRSSQVTRCHTPACSIFQHFKAADLRNLHVCDWCEKMLVRIQ